MTETTVESEESFAIDLAEEQRPSEAILEIIAAVEDVPVYDLHPPLYNVIDPDALDTLLTGDSRPNRIVFSYNGHDVTVEHDGHVVVD